MDPVVMLLGVMLAGAAVIVALLAIRSRDLDQKLEAAEERIRVAEKRAATAAEERHAVQAHFQGVVDAEAERDRLASELTALHREVRLLEEQRRAADVELAEAQRRLTGLRAELAPLVERARLPIPSPNGLADRPESRS